MRVEPASALIRRRLHTAARRLGAADPCEAIGSALDRTFELPLGDARYGNNSLIPGYLPLEHSFSEVAPGTLRFDFEPLGPAASAGARRDEASREVRQLVHRGFGMPALRWFDERSEPWRNTVIPGAARFGAWLGLATDERGLQECKVYYELQPGDLEALPPNLRHVAQVAMAALPGLSPLFVSISCGRRRGNQRLYFAHRGDLRLLDLEPMMNRLGIGGPLPSLLSAVGLILGGRFILPEGSVLVGLRDTTKGIEMKLDLLLPGITEPPEQMHGLIQMHLAQRPESQRSMRHWMQAMTPDSFSSPGDLSALSVRVSPQSGARLSIYLRPVGYDSVPTRSVGRTTTADPYVLTH